MSENITFQTWQYLFVPVFNIVCAYIHSYQERAERGDQSGNLVTLLDLQTKNTTRKLILSHKGLKWSWYDNKEHLKDTIAAVKIMIILSLTVYIILLFCSHLAWWWFMLIAGGLQILNPVMKLSIFLKLEWI